MNPLYKYIPCKAIDVFNMIQDMRHVCLLDTRTADSYTRLHIRDAVRFEHPPQNPQTGSPAGLAVDSGESEVGKIVDYMNRCDKKFSDDEAKYNLKKIRRLVVVPRDNSPETCEAIHQTLRGVAASHGVSIDKVYVMVEDFEKVESTYPFVCIKDNIYSEETMYAFSRFPIILIQDELMVGNVYSMNNKRQMNDMGVKSVVKFGVYATDEQGESFIRSSGELYDGRVKVHECKINFDKFIEFDSIHEYLAGLERPLLLCDSFDMKIAGVFSISYFMNINKSTNCQQPTLVVSQKIGTTDYHKLIYSQLMTYSVHDNNKFIKIG